jgi:hypothetical protein
VSKSKRFRPAIAMLPMPESIPKTAMRRDKSEHFTPKK